MAALVGVGCGEQDGFGDVEHGGGFDFDLVGIGFVLDVEAGFGFAFGEDSVAFVHGHVLVRGPGGEGFGGGGVVLEAAGLGFGLPLGGVVVARKQDAAVCAQALGDDLLHGLVAVAALGFDGVGQVVQGLGQDQVQDGAGVGAALVGAHGAELELVAGEGHGGSSVAVGDVPGEVGQGVDAQLEGVAGGLAVGAAFDEVLYDGFELCAQEDREDGGGGFVGAQAVVVAGGGDRGAQQVLV